MAPVNVVVADPILITLVRLTLAVVIRYAALVAKLAIAETAEYPLTMTT